MSIILKCLSCGEIITVDDSMAGESFKCPKCQTNITCPKGVGIPLSEKDAYIRAKEEQRGRNDADWEEVPKSLATGCFLGGCAPIVGILIAIGVVFLIVIAVGSMF